MSDDILLEGIETNNLKNIDVSIKKNAINLIVGPSGSGKSSLAYDTIAQIGQHELLSMFADDVAEPTYKIKSYSNMLAAVPIKQSNHNNNMRSTIGTYFGMNRVIGLFFSVLTGAGEDSFVLNKESNLCPQCHGLGFERVLDVNRIINYNLPLKRNPVRCWNRYKDFYAQIIEQYCADYGIDSGKTFRQLSEKEKHSFLYGESEQKYSIRYKKTPNYSRRTTKYYGIMTGIPMMPKFAPTQQYYSDKTCTCCQGKRYSPEIENYQINGLSIGDFMTMPFDRLVLVVDRLMAETQDNRLTFSLKGISAFLRKANELNLGHLFFHRSIPTLSGGELQRLRMVQVFITQLSDLLIVLDEPLAGLSGVEKESVFNNIIELAKKHTTVIVDHSDIFAKNAKVIIALGEKGGNEGGRLINPHDYLNEQKKRFVILPPKQNDSIEIKTVNEVYQYHGANLTVAKNCMNLISGPSGVGKSTLLREYMPQLFEKYKYVSQKPIQGNKNSSVATALEIFDNISTLFAKKFNKDKRFFSSLTGNEGACPICGGAGYLEYGNDSSKTRIECRDCQGTGFNSNLKKYKVAGSSIFDIWNMTVDEAISFFKPIDKNTTKVLEDASSILLGHLRIGQPTESLSGGENIRIKILKSAKTTSDILGIDEPFKGLSNSEIYSVALFLDQIMRKGKTVIVVDHTETAEPYFTKHIVLKNRDGVLSEE